MFGIVNLEALACGLPIACNRTPVLEWIVGPAGHPEDITAPGGLVRQWERLADPQVRAAIAPKARERAERMFSEGAILEQVTRMYNSVMTAPERGAGARLSAL